jgi:hypothetical protein
VSRVRYDAGGQYFQSAPRGQEFIIEEDARVERWAEATIASGSCGQLGG